MRTVEFVGWSQPVSALGFGCASLGSRISRKAGIAAIERALGAGVTWFDVAPSYGDGEAEVILGEVLAGTGAAIVTKVGLEASPSGWKKLVRGAVRPVVAAVPGLRAMAKSARSGDIQRLPLTGESIRASIGRSLKRLRVDRVAALMLHDPSDEDARREDVLGALADVKRQGLAARVGIAGSFAAFQAASGSNPVIDVAQFAASPAAGASGRVGALGTRRAFSVLHSVFAAKSEIGRVNGDVLAEAPLRYCFGANPNGVVLASSFAVQHLAMNVRVANEQPDLRFATAVEAALRGDGGQR